MTIQPGTIRFLKALSKNNNRDWFKANKAKYDAALANMKEFVEAIKEGLNETDNIEKGKIFRIYRDVRFSKNKEPYKNYFGAAFTRATAQLRGGYYIHIEPSNCFLGGGFWAPNPADLKRIRQEFEMDDQYIRKIISDKKFKKYFGELRGDAVKTAPKGFSREHPAIDLIRMKQFTVMRPFSDEAVLKKTFLKEVKKTFEAMRPYFDYMSEVLTTDLNGESVLN